MVLTLLNLDRIQSHRALHAWNATLEWTPRGTSSEDPFIALRFDSAVSDLEAADALVALIDDHALRIQFHLPTPPSERAIDRLFRRTVRAVSTRKSSKVFGNDDKLQLVLYREGKFLVVIKRVPQPERLPPATIDAIATAFPSLDGLKAPEAMRRVELFLEAIGEPTREALQQYLDSIAGQILNTMEEKKDFAQNLHAVLGRLGLRIECTSCEAPAVLRAGIAGTAADGNFTFEHRTDGRTQRHGGKTRIPQLRLVDAPQDLKDR